MDAADVVALHARLSPSRIAAVDLDEGRTFSYAALDADIARCVSVLLTHGCGRGDRVVAVAKNHISIPVLHHACARLGAIFAPLNFRLAKSELSELIARCRPRLVVGDTRLPDSPPTDLSLSELGAQIANADATHVGPMDARLPSLLLFTSGTTGRPKGALLSELNLFETAVNFSLLGAATRASVFLCDAPMFHVIGLVNNVRTALYHGGTFLVSSGFSPERTLQRLMDPSLRVSHYFCVPQMLEALASLPEFSAQALGQRVTVFTGGAPHAAASVRALLGAGLSLSHGYGMTEVGCIFHCPIEPALALRHAGSVGIPSPRFEVRIVDAAGSACATGEVGELQVRGDTVFGGYFEDERATCEAFEDGWFKTGDLFCRDGDGYYHAVDRKKDMFITGGENVYPAELEAHLAGFPGLRDAAVVGVPDARWGEVGHLVFVSEAGARPSPEAMLQHLEARVGRFKLPRHVTELSELPRTASGKLQRQRLRDLLQGARGSDEHQESPRRGGRTN